MNRGDTRPFEDQRLGVPGIGTESEADQHLKEMVKNQLDTNVSLQRLIVQNNVTLPVLSLVLLTVIIGLLIWGRMSCVLQTTHLKKISSRVVDLNCTVLCELHLQAHVSLVLSYLS